MARINDWLDDRVQDIIHAPGLHTRKGDFRDLATNGEDGGKYGWLARKSS